MRLKQDALLGAFFASIGIGAGLIALTYPFGTASRMGPGFFPVVIAALLTLTGLAILVRARLADAPTMEPTSWRGVAIIPAMVVVFGLMIEPLGLPLAVLLLIIGTATASVRFALDWKALAGSVLFAAVCALLFVKLLGLPIPLAGSWLPFGG